MNYIEELITLLDTASRDSGHHFHERPDGSVRASPKSAGTAGVFSLRGMTAHPKSFQERSLLSVTEVPTVELVPLNAALLERSRVAAAGATIIIHEDVTETRNIPPNSVAFLERPRILKTIEAASFAPVNDGSNVATTARSVNRVKVSFNGPSYGLRHELTRDQQKEFGLKVVAEELMESIVLGIARAADHALLRAIVAATPGAFSIGAAATAGLNWSELHAFVGTAGAGAAVAQDGNLRVAGVPASLTPTISQTIVGSFRRSAVAVFDDLKVIVERHGKAGALAVTVWVDVKALLPAPGFFWAAA